MYHRHSKHRPAKIAIVLVFSLANIMFSVVFPILFNAPR